MANLVSTTFTGDVSLNGNATLRANGQVDATSFTGNGAGLSGVDPFEANTSMIFNQASAPTGWTKQTGAALANTAMSIVTGTGGGTGGSDSFYSTFTTGRAVSTGNIPVSGSLSGTVGSTTLSTPTIASHTHTGWNPNENPQPNQGGVFSNNLTNVNRVPRTDINVLSPAGGGGSHSHPFSGSLSSASTANTPLSIPAMNIKYANVIVANKD